MTEPVDEMRGATPNAGAQPGRTLPGSGADGGRIRRVEAEDIAQIAELDRLGFGDEAWPQEMIVAELAAPSGRYFVAEDGGQLVGYGGIRVGKRDSEVMTIAVDPAEQGRGWGRALMEKLIEAGAEAGSVRVWLIVAEDAEPAYNLYLSLGFVPVERVPGYYRLSARDGILMVLAFNQ
ncbi:MAG: ribosomal protein S18-alanine N-acetyltransferase [Bifidobacteriaceae bacterium]|jgi:ribosomal-protein-alanine N-acetyltransferase|nr:ribosomal protein S18-alanine N-acetyltransferase [Bifidobacteriaceae bacterium]